MVCGLPRSRTSLVRLLRLRRCPIACARNWRSGRQLHFPPSRPPCRAPRCPHRRPSSLRGSTACRRCIEQIQFGDGRANCWPSKARLAIRGKNSGRWRASGNFTSCESRNRARIDAVSTGCCRFQLQRRRRDDATWRNLFRDGVR
jgi:hypothetical protein